MRFRVNMGISAVFRIHALLFSLAIPASAALPVVPAEVVQSVKDRVDFGYTPGVIVGMINADGRTVFAYGAKSYEDPTLPDTSTIYEIASVTKVFTTVLLAQMARAGDVELSDFAGDFLPAGQSMPANGGDLITLEHLATHHSSLPRDPPNLFDTILDVANPYENYTVADLYDLLDSFVLPRAPDTSYEYSNTGIGLLGHVLALSESTNFEDLLIQRVLDPIGLSDTRVVLSPEQESRFVPGHAGVVQRPPFRMNVLTPAGGLRSTVTDLLTFLEHNLGLAASSLNAAMQDSHQERADSADATSIGLGWWRFGDNDVHIQHGGDSLGTAAFIGFRASTQTGVVVLSNNRTNRFTGVFDLGFRCLNDQVPLNPIVEPPDVPVSELRTLYGTYVNGDMTLEVGLQHDRLTLTSRSDGVPFTLYPDGSRKFTALDVITEPFGTFNVNASDQVTSLTWTQGGNTTVFTRSRMPAQLAVAAAAGTLCIELTGEGDRDYNLEWSDDLLEWQPMAPRTIWDGPYKEPVGNGERFFRIADP